MYMLLLPFCCFCFCRSFFPFSCDLMTVFSVFSEFHLISCIYIYLLCIFGLQLPWSFCIAVFFKLLIFLFQMHLKNPPFVLFPHDYCFWCNILFTSNCFLYPFTAYCGYKWPYHSCLITSLLTLWMDSYLYCMFVFTNEPFHLVIFLILVVAFSFLPREVSLTFVVMLVW